MLRISSCFRPTGFTLLLSALAIPALAQAATTAAGATPEQQARSTWYQGISSGYKALDASTESLLQHAEAYCVKPSAEARQNLESTWKQAFGDWQRVRFVDLGPVETNNRAWQFQFWTDPKNLIARKADLLLKDGAALGPETVGQAGVAVQGFPMLEYLLFDTPFNTGGRALPAEASCQLFTRVSSHIQDNSKTLSEEWTEFRSHYLATDSYTHATIRSAMTALEVAEERRLATPMGLRGNGKRSVYAADAWRSGNSLASVGASVDGLQAIFLPGLVQLLNAKGQSELAQRISKQFDEVQEHFPAIDRPLTALLEDDNEFRNLQGLYVDLSQLTTLVKGEAATTLGVIRGFNSSDGD